MYSEVTGSSSWEDLRPGNNATVGGANADHVKLDANDEDMRLPGNGMARQAGRSTGLRIRLAIAASLRGLHDHVGSMSVHFGDPTYSSSTDSYSGQLLQKACDVVNRDLVNSKRHNGIKHASTSKPHHSTGCPCRVYTRRLTTHPSVAKATIKTHERSAVWPKLNRRTEQLGST